MLALIRSDVQYHTTMVAIRHVMADTEQIKGDTAEIKDVVKEIRTLVSSDPDRQPGELDAAYLRRMRLAKRAINDNIALVVEQKRQRFNATIDPRVWEEAPIDPIKDLDEQIAKFNENQRIQKQIVMAKVIEIKAEAKKTKVRRG